VDTSEDKDTGDSPTEPSPTAPPAAAAPPASGAGPAPELSVMATRVVVPEPAGPPVAPPGDGTGNRANDGTGDGTGGDSPAVARGRRPRRWRRRVAWLVAVPVVLLLAVVAAWAIDSATNADAVARNTELVGTPVGGMSRAQLDAAVLRLDEQLPSTKVVIDTGDLTLASTAGDLGLSIDPTATSKAVMDAGRTGSVLTRPVEWARSFVTPRAADVELQVDQAKLDAALTTLEGDKRTAPVEPGLVEKDGAIVLTPGVNGVQLEPAAVLAALPPSLGNVGEEVRVEAKRTTVPPKTSDAQVQALVDEANKVVSSKINVKAGNQSFTLDGKDLLGGFTIDTSSGAPKLSLSDKAIGLQLAKQQPSASANPTGVKFDISGGVPVPVAGKDAQVCCGEGASAQIVDALLAGKTDVEVPTRTMAAAEGVTWANSLGVKEVIGQFTTPHAAGEPRVTNIHKMADTIRGAVIPPGATFSVNDYVGRRTADKGYVSAPVIINNKHEMDIGGGVSQFATTFFNAAFFGGLDIPQYQMHSEYISRYPYGREATLFYPNVDLKIRNNSPYGVVIWPTYTDRSLTVQLWSTKYASGEQTAQSQSSGCGPVTTERTRTFVDGHTEKDKFQGNYYCGP